MGGRDLLIYFNIDERVGGGHNTVPGNREDWGLVYHHTLTKIINLREKLVNPPTPPPKGHNQNKSFKI